jgi:hypothetical protein
VVQIADNVLITSGSGTSIATDQNGSDHVQIMKVTYGADGSFTLVSPSNPFPVAVTSAVTTITDGRKVVATAGTKEPLASSTACKEVVITAETDNTGIVVVGAAGTVVAAIATRRGVPLAAGDSIVLQIDNLADIGLDSTVSGDGVTFAAFS